MRINKYSYAVTICFIIFCSLFFIPKIDRLTWRAVSILEFKILKVLSDRDSKPYNANKLNEFVVASHRGIFSNKICDNTERSIILATQIGFSFIELDVSFSKDYIPIIFHDNSFKRKANLDKKPSEVYWKEIQKLILFDGQRILSLDTILKKYSNKFRGIILDIKTDDIEINRKVTSINNILQNYQNQTNLYVIGMPFNLISAIKNQNQNLKVGCENLGAIYNYIAGMDLISLNYYKQFSTLEYYLAKMLGLDVIIWTVNEYDEIVALKKKFSLIVLTDLNNITASTHL